MTLLMPTWHPVKDADMPPMNLPKDLELELPPEMIALQKSIQIRAVILIRKEVQNTKEEKRWKFFLY